MTSMEEFKKKTTTDQKKHKGLSQICQKTSWKISKDEVLEGLSPTASYQEELEEPLSVGWGGVGGLFHNMTMMSLWAGSLEEIEMIKYDKMEFFSRRMKTSLEQVNEN